MQQRFALRIDGGMTDPRPIVATEAVALSGATDARVICGREAIEAAGFDPDVYLAIIPSGAMRGGKLNKNGRIYGPPEDVAARHLELVQRARESYVGSRQGHPREDAIEADNPQAPTDAARILDGAVIANEDGSVDCTALVGLLDTTRGRDTYVMWKAGKPTGLSLRGMVQYRDQVVTEGSDLARMNPAAVGKTVEVRRFIAPLETYDVVVDPSFATFFDPPPGIQATESVVTDADSAEVREAAQRLSAAGAIVTPARGQETTMEIKDIAGLEAAFPELVKQLRDGAVQAATESATVNVAAANERIAALEASVTKQAAEAAEAKAALAIVQADLKRKALEASIAKTMEDWSAGKPGAGPIVERIRKAVDEGKFSDATEAVSRADDLYEIAKQVAVAGGTAIVPPVAERAGVKPGTESVESDCKPGTPVVSVLDL